MRCETRSRVLSAEEMSEWPVTRIRKRVGKRKTCRHRRLPASSLAVLGGGRRRVLLSRAQALTWSRAERHLRTLPRNQIYMHIPWRIPGTAMCTYLCVAGPSLFSINHDSFVIVAWAGRERKGGACPAPLALALQTAPCRFQQCVTTRHAPAAPLLTSQPTRHPPTVPTERPNGTEHDHGIEM